MVSNWTRYLCVRHVRPGAGAAEICAYEPLCEFDPYDEDGNPVDIPTEIDGKPVVRFEDGYLVGGELSPENDESIYEYTSKTLHGLQEWIKDNHFEISDISLAMIKKALEEPA